jgi:hypothetical protein
VLLDDLIVRAGQDPDDVAADLEDGMAGMSY